MEARELRIGNWYKGDMFGGGEYQITPEDIQNLHDDPQDDFYQPIPITEERLVRFGFEKQYDDHVYDKDNFRIELIWWADDDPEWKLKRHDGVSFSRHSAIKTKYVHQLQNLYFALTGEELTIESPN